MDEEEETRGETSTACGAVARDGAGRATDMICVELIDPGGLLRESERSRLRDWLISAVGSIQATGEVRVRLVNDREMSDAHLRYGGVEGTTDVLTFDMREGRAPGKGDGMAAPSGRGGGGGAERLDVDIWACVDEAGREASARGHGVEQELLLYCLHGVLHCLGYDDHDPAEHERMHAEEDRILEAIGVGRIYAAEPRMDDDAAVPGGQE